MQQRWFCKCFGMKSPFRYFKASPEIIRLAVMMYVRFSTVATQCRGPSPRARDRGEPRHDPVLVEPFWPDLPCRDPQETDGSNARCVARDGRIRSASGRPLAEQSCGEFTPAVPATRTRDTPFQADGRPPEICHCPFSRLQPFQPATTPPPTGQFQGQPSRCTCPVASTQGGLIPCPRWRIQTCDITLTVPPIALLVPIWPWQLSLWLLLVRT